MAMEDIAAVIERAERIKKTLGVRRAAGYLRNQGICLGVAIDILFYPATWTYYINDELQILAGAV